MKTGRPEKYTEELANKILDEIATTSRSLRTICKDNGLAVSTLLLWLKDDEEFSTQYARAKESQADLLAEEILAIADAELKTTDVTIYENSEGGGSSKTTRDNIQRARLMIDSRKWLASKLKPKKYGDTKPEEETTPEDSNTYEDFMKKIKDA